ncbi:hypothetical protein DIPPA_27682 [Diplonema papillatum]|nr:hypothetical protein DIPPA_27682 [Diplonema papillatum]
MFETVAAPVLYFRSPRPAALTQDDLKQQMTVGGGTTIWILSDEWMLPFGDRLRECIADIIAAKDRIIVPYYCMMRLGRIVRRGQSNTQLREAAFNVLQILQELFDASAEATERGEPVIADTLFFNEQLWSHDLFRSVLEKQDVPERDKDSIAALSERPIRYDIELEFAGSLSERPTVKYLSRRSIVYALEIKQMQMQRTSVIFCARNSEHLKLAKKLGLDCHSVEDVLGPDWLKHRREEDEKLMLSWKGPEDRLAIEAAPFQALTASSFAENAYWQGDHNVVSLEDTPPPAAGKAPAQADDMASYTPPTRSDNAAAAATEPHSAAPQDDAAPAHTASPPETPRHSDAAAKDTLSEEAEGSAAPAAPFDPESPRAAGEAAQGDSTAEPQPANAAPTPGEAAESAENPTDLGARPEDAEGSSAPAGSLDPKEAARRVSTAEPHKSTWGAIKTKAASPPAQEEDVADYKPAESKKPE